MKTHERKALLEDKKIKKELVEKELKITRIRKNKNKKLWIPSK